MISSAVIDAITPATSRAVLISEFNGFPEHMAVVNDDLAALDGGNPDAKHDDCSPLALAIRLHRTAIAERLLDAGANRVLPQRFMTPARLAARVGNESIMALMVRAKANLKVSAAGDTIVHLAARNPDAGALRVLLGAGVPFDAHNNDGERPIHLAAKNANQEVTAMLIAAGAKIAADCSILHRAAQHNPNAAVLRVLIDAGSDVNACDRDKENALLKACMNTNIEVLDALLAAGAKWRDGANTTVGRVAAMNPNEAILRRVIAAGLFDSDALPFAVKSSSAAVVTLMLDAGADRQSPLLATNACENVKHRGVMSVLIAAGVPCDDDAVWKLAIARSNVDALSALIAAGRVTVQQIRAMPLSQLMSAAAAVGGDAAAMLEFLIEQRVDFRVSDSDGWTIGHVASNACLAVLFAHGANLDARDNEGRSPLQTACGDGGLLTLFAAGIDAASFRGTASLDEQPLLAAMGLIPENSNAWVTHPKLMRACNRIAQRQFDLFKLRAFQVCVGLATLELPALISCEILFNVFAPIQSLVPLHRVWKTVTTIKHHHKQR